MSERPSRRTPAAGRPRKVAPKQGYHHQDLRRALLDAAINALRAGDVTTLTMQALARQAGVTAAAPYHHFADKLDLLAALATEGWELWLEAASAAEASSSIARSQLTALARAWVAFTAAHPSHYRVMLLPDLADRARFAAMHATSGRALALLLRVLARAHPRMSSADLAGRAVATWSALHGFAHLAGAGVLTNIPGLPSLASLEDVLVARTVAAALG